MSMDPDPDRTPDLEPGGGVAPGSTPPDTPQTSGLSAPEPRTSNTFPPTGVGAVALIVILAVVFLIAAIGIILTII
ncbi:hypothetical protein IU449_12725 [Nocardia higoensis]|uniref:Uncharacterized protein n=1 Tax=Nocardia higoensis TaxID=228599 RepID=A0ABS0DCS1_9NOCA|nr:DUF6480 family protein [Nocardia higoensis]MBF6355397.1 hypothetical protein [Nocardia higoensis]